MTYFGKLKNSVTSLFSRREKSPAQIDPTVKVRVRPGIHVLATGGTIAGRRVSTGPRYRAGALGIEALLDAVPGLRGFGELSAEQIANIGSQDMNEEVWLKLSRRANELLNNPACHGIVVTHGTDTLEETACFLDLTLVSDKPVVLVGAMRPAGSLGADGQANLYDAVAVASNAHSASRGVLVVMHGSVFEARSVTKVSSTSIQAFDAPGSGPTGQVVDGQVHFARPAARLSEQPSFDVSRLDNLPRVGIIYGHAGASVEPVRALVEAGFRGIVCAGVGNGNLPRDVLDALAEASGKKVVVVRSSRITGRTLRDMEVDDNRFGFVTSGALNPQKARVLLQLALTRTRTLNEIQSMFDHYC